jgi:hypothetical protein
MICLETRELRRSLPATAAAAESFCSEFREWHEREIGGVNAFAAELLLREALANSILHPTESSRAAQSESPAASERFVSCAVRCTREGKLGRLLIVVSDAGEGFDWRKALRRQPKMAQANGRGLAIYRTYADRFRFNAAGNSIALLKRFQDRGDLYEKENHSAA